MKKLELARQLYAVVAATVLNRFSSMRISQPRERWQQVTSVILTPYDDEILRHKNPVGQFCRSYR